MCVCVCVCVISRQLYNGVFNQSFEEYKQYGKRLLRIFSAQAQDIYSVIPVYIHYVMFDSQNILLYICKQYINIICHMLQQEILLQIQRYLNSL